MGQYLEICDSVTRDRWAKRAATLLSRVGFGELRADYRHQFEERAAVCEYDGGVSRDEAERIAFEELRHALEHGSS